MAGHCASGIFEEICEVVVRGGDFRDEPDSYEPSCEVAWSGTIGRGLAYMNKAQTL